MPITRAAGFPVFAGSGVYSLPVTWQTVGDLAVFSVQVPAVGSNTIGSVSSANTSGWVKVGDYTDALENWYEGIWIGTVIAAGADTVTFTITNSIVPNKSVVDELAAGPAVAWAAGANGALRTSTGTAINYPSLTAGAGATQAYWGFTTALAQPSAGPTAGFAWSVSSPNWMVCFNGALTPSTAVQPIGTMASSTQAYSCGTIIVATTTVPATGTGAMAFDGSGTATATGPVAAGGSGAMAFDGTGTARAFVAAAATGTAALVFDGLATATLGAPAPPTYIFTPPAERYVPPVPANEDGRNNPGWRLMQYYHATHRGVNVFKLSDGTYPRDDVTGVWPTTDVVPNDAISSSWGIGSASPIITPINPEVLYVYYGGHSYQVDATEAQNLINAGYGDNVVPSP